MTERIIHKGRVIALIIRKSYKQDGINFLTPDNYLLQIGFMTRLKGYHVLPHIHNPVRRSTIGTQEVLFIKSGKIRVDFYSDEKIFLKSRILFRGDIVFFAGAGHGIEILKKAVIVEVKNGPYIKESDKGRFERGNRNDTC